MDGIQFVKTVDHILDANDFRTALISWGQSHYRSFPWRQTRDPYCVLMAEIMLHRTQATQVLPVYERFVVFYPDIQSLVQAKKDDLHQLLYSLGLRWRVNLIQTMAAELIDRFNGKVPQERDDLMSLPGVSDYIASAVRCFAWNFPDPIIDTNVVRVIGRLFGIEVKDSSRRNQYLKRLISTLVDTEKARIYNFALLDLADQVCMKKNHLSVISALYKKCADMVLLILLIRELFKGAESPMVEPTSRSSGTQILRPRARILRTFGDELISSETVAIIELVKNAYDADATRVLVRFSGSIEIGKGQIEVIDNGHGMSLNSIQTTWMEPATIFKKRQSRSERLKRRVLGEKGVGRFAASKLADFLEVVTRRTESDNEVRVFFDWSQFDDEQKYLDQVQSLWEEVEPSEICPGGIIQSLWREDEQPNADELTHGTILRMERLRSDWTENQFKDLQRRLSRLISPFFDEDAVSKNDTFQVYLDLPEDLPESFENLSGIIRPPDFLKNPLYLLKGCVDATGHYSFTFSTAKQRDPEQLEGQFPIQHQHAPQCGPFCIEFRVWDRDSASLEEMARRYNSTLRDIRRDLDDSAGINIYRDGFRILPYGEQRNDWLRLD